MIERGPPRTALFLPGSRPGAIAKARELPVDMVILDLEDAVAPADKPNARQGAVAALAEGFGDRLGAVRVNPWDSEHLADDLVALAGCRADVIVLPKAEAADDIARLHESLGKPVLAMIETPRGLRAADAIAGAPGTAGLIAGTNDLRATLGLPDDGSREGLVLALQTIVLAARVAGVWTLDGVHNGLEDSPELAEECRQGRAFGFDGKSLIHPAQIEAVCRAFADSPGRIAEARGLLEAYRGGAERFGGRMIEAMHVAQARGVLLRAGEPLP